MIKVFLVLVVLYAGAERPEQQGYEVGDWKECGEQLKKFTEQPMIEGAEAIQVSCVAKKVGVRS